MAPDRHGGGTQQTPATADPTRALTDDASGRTDSPPIARAAVSSKVSEHDSLVTVRLSEPPTLHVNTTVPPSTIYARKSPLPELEPTTDATAEAAEEGGEDDDDEDSDSDIFEPETKRRPNLLQELGQAGADSTDDDGGPRRRRDSSSSSGSERVDWEGLQKKEDLASKEQDSQNSTASLLAKLEQENDRIATNPKSIKVKAAAQRRSREGKPRPPSMAQLQKMVNGPTPAALRYSTLPPPPMTELEFYLALVKDPKQTAARLPTLLSNKVRRGIPPPLRGVVWQSLAGARDGALEDMFERLTGESSPYEGVISKDLGRSFPGVDMFRDPEGDGQRMLGRVLKCFSLYDTKIGYCQGLAFLVGPLLMHMPDKQAFCVLIRLMENYDLRQCFVPDLAGLHIRIYQFRELLRQHLPTLSVHLDELQVEPAYVSQWFLSFFAVTCPLPMLFRIYDVIFVDGSDTTLMRVALSLMRKNQGRILACTELEDVMHLLLSRGLWDCYNHNADELVHDFVALSDVVTRERMIALEQGYREVKISSAANHRGTGTGSGIGTGGGAAHQPSADVTTAASRFLGRIWAVSSSTPRFATFATAASASGTASAAGTNAVLNPGLGAAASRPLSMLRRTTSKHSLASMEAASSSTTSSAASVLSSASTEATTISRDSSADHPPREATATLPKPAGPTVSLRSVSTSKDDSRHLHSQIEDLLTALSELQRNHALLASQLQREKEDREEDRRAVQSLLDGLRRKAGGESGEDTTRPGATKPAQLQDVDDTSKPTAEQLSDLLDVVESRFSESPTSPMSSIPETKSQLREEIARAREQLLQERARTKEYDRKVQEMEQEAASMREQLRESHAHVRNVHQEKQRLERQIHTMRIRASDTPAAATAPGSSAEKTGGGSDWWPKAISSTITAAPTAPAPSSSAGLRELKLGRSKSTPSQPYAKRASSISTNQIPTHTPQVQKKPSNESLAAYHHHPQQPGAAPLSETDTLLLELVQAKTAEAVARQELEEARQKLEQLRRAFGLAPGETPPPLPPAGASGQGQGQQHTAASAASAAMGMLGLGRLTGAAVVGAGAGGGATGVGVGVAEAGGGNTATVSAASSGGFWGWRR